MTGLSSFREHPWYPARQTCRIRGLRTDQGGESTFPEFLAATWSAGVIRYDVDFAARNVAYYGCDGEAYIETYPAVQIE